MDQETLQDVVRNVTIRPFHTAHVIEVLMVRYPDVWGQLVKEYGMGGRGAGSHYSAFSRVSQALHRMASNGIISKLDYQPAPADLNWGSPVIRFWTDTADGVGQLFPDEIGEDEEFPEGQRQSIFVNRYERNPEARQKCLEVHGVRCSACDFDFEQAYGDRGKGFIHVHHLMPIHLKGGQYNVDPINDLRPVCPNCHAMIHRYDPVLSIEKLRTLLGKTPNSM